MEWPDWWDWEIELSPHLLERMVDRSFNEAELREMLEDASGFRRDVIESRYVIETRWNEGRWEIIVEPDDSTERLVVVTAYPSD